MMKYTTSPVMKNLLFILLASAGLSFAHNAPAAETGAGASVQMGGSVDAAAAGTDAKAGAGAATQMSPEGMPNQTLPMTQDSTRMKEHAQERMGSQGMEYEQAIGKKEADKKTAKSKREKKPVREEP